MTGRVARSAPRPGVVPSVGPMRPSRLPSIGERTLDNGARVLVSRRPGIPRFELQLRIPTVRGAKAEDQARMTLLAETLLSGTPQHTSVEIAETSQRLGGSLATGADAEWLIVSGSALSTSLSPFLALLGEVVTEASFPPEEVSVERDRVSQELLVALSQPDTIARDALWARLYPEHPYGRGTPAPAAVARVAPAALRRALASRALPAGSVLAIVGDVAPARALGAVEASLGEWAEGTPGAADQTRLRPPRPPSPGPIVLVDRPGAVQTNIRLGGPALPRQHPDFPALALANVIFGGYFTSRLVDNIRERRGYTYSPRSVIEHRAAASTLWIGADVGTDVTAAALVEIQYELGRMVATDVEQLELDAARRYVQGALAMAVQTQAGLCTYAAVLATLGLDIGYLRSYPAALEKVTIEQVRAAAAAYLAPSRLVTVLVGDAAAIAPSVGAVAEVEVRSVP